MAEAELRVAEQPTHQGHALLHAGEYLAHAGRAHECRLQVRHCRGDGRYKDSLQAVKQLWKRDGIPQEYRGWDEGSLERQQNLLAANPVQARLALLADLAVERKLIHLASRELERRQATSLHRELLEEFLVLGVERVMELVKRLARRVPGLAREQIPSRRALV